MTPGAALAQVVNCHDHISRAPIAAAAPTAKARPARVHRVRPAAAARPRAHRTHHAATAKAGPKRITRAHRVRPRPAARPAVGPAPTPYLLAAQSVAVPVTYALIHVTTCANAAPTLRLMSLRGQPAPAIEDVGPPVIGIVPEPGGTTFIDTPGPDGLFPGSGFPPGGGPGGGVTSPGGGVVPPGGGEPPIVAPPTPPTEPPIAVPEPAAWALMLLGFGAVGAALRRRGRLAGSQRN